MSAMIWAYWPKPPLHGLSLRKSLIKNHNNIISVWIIIWIKHNQTPQSPIKYGTITRSLFLSSGASHYKMLLFSYHSFLILSSFHKASCTLLSLKTLKRNLQWNYTGPLQFTLSTNNWQWHAITNLQYMVLYAWNHSTYLFVKLVRESIDSYPTTLKNILTFQD